LFERSKPEQKRITQDEYDKTGRALMADALFRIASMTKAITSVAAMQLIEQGRFGLDDPVEKYPPEFAGLKVFESFDAATGAYRLRPASKPPTTRHVLTHTSGLGYPFTSAILRDFKPQPGENYPFGGPLLFDRALALRHEHRCCRQAGRESVRPETRGLLPPAHLRPTPARTHEPALQPIRRGVGPGPCGLMCDAGAARRGGEGD
jgi:Beta-lactamase